MEPELKDKIKEWDKKLDPKVAKKLFIRSSAISAYKEGNGDIKNVTTQTLKDVIDIISVNYMTKEQIGMHIANLEEARTYLAALTQGFQIAFSEEMEPKFKAKRDAEDREKKARQPKDIRSQLERLGIDADKLFSKMAMADSISKQVGLPAATNPSLPIIEPKIPEKVIEKIKCEKCGKEMYPAMKSFHKC